MKCLKFKILEFDKKFIEWVKYKNGGDDPKPILDSIRDEFSTHYVVERPPFSFNHKGPGSYILQVPSRNSLFLFASAKANGRIKIYGGLFHDGSEKVRDDTPFMSELPSVPVDHGTGERDKVCVYLKERADLAEYADDAEIYEALILDLRALKHHGKAECNGQQRS